MRTYVISATRACSACVRVISFSLLGDFLKLCLESVVIWYLFVFRTSNRFSLMKSNNASLPILIPCCLSSWLIWQYIFFPPTLVCRFRILSIIARTTTACCFLISSARLFLWKACLVIPRHWQRSLVLEDPSFSSLADFPMPRATTFLRGRC